MYGRKIKNTLMVSIIVVYFIGHYLMITDADFGLKDETLLRLLSRQSKTLQYIIRVYYNIIIM